MVEIHAMEHAHQNIDNYYYPSDGISAESQLQTSKPFLPFWADDSSLNKNLSDVDTLAKRTIQA